jgi:hypothetical protein
VMFKRNRNCKSRVARLCWSNILRFGMIMPVLRDRMKSRKHQQ